jgi:hypothetical protein
MQRGEARRIAVNRRHGPDSPDAAKAGEFLAVGHRIAKIRRRPANQKGAGGA